MQLLFRGQAQLANASAPIFDGVITAFASPSLIVLPVVVVEWCTDDSWNDSGQCDEPQDTGSVSAWHRILACLVSVSLVEQPAIGAPGRYWRCSVALGGIWR